MKQKDLIILGCLALGGYLLYKSGILSGEGGQGFFGGNGTTTPITTKVSGGSFGGTPITQTEAVTFAPRTQFIKPVATSGRSPLKTIPKLNPKIIVTGSGFGYLRSILTQPQRPKQKALLRLLTR